MFEPTQHTLMPDGSVRKVGGIRDTYGKLLDDWTRGSALAAAAEYDPYFAIKVSGKPHLDVMGTRIRGTTRGAAGGPRSIGAWVR